MKNGINRLKNITAKSVSDADRITFSMLNNQYNFPFVIGTNYSDANISGWMQNNRTLIDLKLKETGALLFRGFQVNSIEKFQLFMTYFGNDVLEYKLRSSPRYAVGEKVYISTKYPQEYIINMHSESSYSPLHPNKIVFCCIVPAVNGGETPIADNRLVLNHISERTKKKFESLGVKYRRFFSNDVGLSWQEAFQTDDRHVVENECRKVQINFEWENQNDLVLTWNKKAIWNHPQTQERVWFNHAFFFNRHAPGQEDLDFAIDHNRLPNNTFFGDGSEITKEEIIEISEAYKKSTIEFKWEKGDVLLLDNMLMSHGRNPFKGDRNIIVSMA
jgi:alpha-ketoglutarate-dependent taurine dioxygenase